VRNRQRAARAATRELHSAFGAALTDDHSAFGARFPDDHSAFGAAVPDDHSAAGALPDDHSADNPALGTIAAMANAAEHSTMRTRLDGASGSIFPMVFPFAARMGMCSFAHARLQQV